MAGPGEAGQRGSRIRQHRWPLLLGVLLVAVQCALAIGGGQAMLSFTLPASAGLCLLAVLWLAPGRWRALGLARLLPACVLATALSALVLWQVPAAFRVQFDESSLTAVAQHLHANGRALLTTAALPYDGEPLGLENTLDKRPPLFALLLAGVHLVLGPQPENAFLLNAGLWWLLLVLVHTALVGRIGLAGAVAGQVLLVATPLLPAVVRSGGFELLALYLLFVVAKAAQAVRCAGTAANWRWLLATAGLLAHARYESILLAALLVAAAVWAQWPAMRRSATLRPCIASCWFLCWLPAAVVPLGFLLLHGQRADFHAEAGGAALWSWQYLRQHLPAFLIASLDLVADSPWSGPAAWLALPGCGYLLLRRRMPSALVPLLAAVLVATLLVASWFFGDVEEPAAARLYLPAVAAMSLAVLSCGRRLGGLLPEWLLLLLVLALAGYRVNNLATAAQRVTSPASKVVVSIDAALAAAPGDGRTQWVSSAAQHLVTRRVAAMPMAAFVRRQPELRALQRTGQLQSLRLLTTPLDAAFAPGFGDPTRLLRELPARLLWRGGEPEVAVYELRW